MDKRRSDDNALGVALFGKAYQFKNDQTPAPLAKGPSDLAKELCEITPSFFGKTPKTVASQFSRYIKDHHHEVISRKALKETIHVFSNRITKRGGDKNDIEAMKKNIASSLQLSIQELEDHINTIPKQTVSTKNISILHGKGIIEDMTSTARELLEAEGFKNAHFTHMRHEAPTLLKILKSDPKLEMSSTQEKLCSEGFPQHAIRNMAEKKISRLAFYCLTLMNE